MSEAFFTAQALAGAAGMPTTSLRVRARLEFFLPDAVEKSTGKGHLYPFSVLPLATQADLISRAVPGWVLTESGKGRPETPDETALRCAPRGAASVPAVKAAQPAPARVAAKPSAALVARDWQRECANARAVLVREVLYLSKYEKIAVSTAADRITNVILNRTADEGVTSINSMETLTRIAAKAVARKDGARLPSAQSLRRWCSIYKQHGGDSNAVAAVAALTPAAREAGDELPSWLPALLAAWQKPMKPALTTVLADLARDASLAEVPTPAQARYWLKKRLGAIAREDGRKTGNALLALQPYFKRDQSDIAPHAIWAADGHCFDAEMQHPETGGAVKPEITLIKDVGTLRIIGASMAQAESQYAILEAITAAAQSEGCLPSMFYTDNGAYRGALLTDESALGLFARYGMTHYTSIPCRPQGHGIIEAAHKILIRAARRFDSYMGKDMDPDAMHRFHRISRKDIRLLRKGAADGRVVKGKARARLPDADEVMANIRAEIDAYNDHPHRSLPKIRDASGIRRHMTPNECHAAWVVKGFEKFEVTPADLADMARPRIARRVARGTVTLGNNVYACRELAEFHGETVQVGYCTGDASRVWIYTHPDGRFICTAGFEENSQAFMPQTALDAAKAKRLAAQAKRLQAHADENAAERWAVTALAAPGTPDMDVIEALFERQKETVAVEDDMADVIELFEQKWG
ncbi:MAG: transposase family protein [Zoogloeaceae bacterium]|jgi:putative transposase|nr:transposase family protein [Zoogloeaceae bacterium]